MRLRLVTEDGSDYPPDQPIAQHWGIELGRPPGSKKGRVFNAPTTLQSLDYRSIQVAMHSFCLSVPRTWRPYRLKPERTREGRDAAAFSI